MKLSFAASAFAALLASAAAADDAQFRRQVAPILERKCVRCHRGDEPKGGLSFTSRQAALKGGESGPAIVPGKPDESLILDYVSGDEPEMPKDGEPLTAAEVAAIRKWIAAGAAWPAGLVLESKQFQGQAWWSLEPLSDEPPPEVGSPWARNPIDAFVLRKLKAAGLEPSPEADRRTLVRRLTYDLHGLPPTPEAVQAFVEDREPRAYERLVERLLASPRYGERWGRHWLDVVHYGESHGYDKDKPRPNAWPYRDWVIRAFNEDKPYARFVEEQLAGDVLYPDDPQAIVATGFIAAGPWDFVGHVELREGTVDKQITRLLDRDDMLSAAMSTFVSLTVHCARCHDHKFDPIKQQDYYRLQAVFAGVERADRPYDPDPQTQRLRRELTARRAALREQQQALEAKIAAVSSPELKRLDEQLAARRKELAALPPAKASSPTNGYHSAIMPTPEHTKWVQVDLGRPLPIGQVRLIPARPTDFPDTPGFGFPVRYQVQVSDDAKFRAARALADHTAADFTNPGDAPVVIRGDDKPARYVRVTATRLWKRRNDYVFALAELQVLGAAKGGAEGAQQNRAAGATVTALDSIEAGRWSRAHLVDGYTSRARLPVAGEKPGRRQALEARIAELAARREKQVEELLDDATRRQRVETATALAEVEKQLAALPAQQLVYAAAHAFKPQGNFKPTPEPRTIHLLGRGSVKNPGPVVAPGAVACVAPLEPEFALDEHAGEGARRAALARWITDERNPLTYRSIVNRVWQYHFGRGLVDSPNDFGRMGSRPSHPELLDWLARRFLASGGSLKALHRLILSSAVYRQSSADREQAAAADSGNRLLWRMNRRRLEAECVRDAMLAVSGKLDLRMGGPADRQFYFKDDHSPVYDYTQFDVDSPAANRRSVYRFIVRSVPDPFMECLDCADPSLLVPKRTTTLTALQALALLNNPFVVRQAEHFAARAQRERMTLAEQLQRAHELALGRAPTREETRQLTGYARRHGLANACRLLLNSNEFLFVD